MFKFCFLCNLALSSQSWRFETCLLSCCVQLKLDCDSYLLVTHHITVRARLFKRWITLSSDKYQKNQLRYPVDSDTISLIIYPTFQSFLFGKRELRYRVAEFFGVPIFAIFQWSLKNRLLQKKYCKHFSAIKFYVTVNIIQLKFDNEITSYRPLVITACADVIAIECQRKVICFTGLTQDTHTVILFENMHFHCTYSIKENKGRCKESTIRGHRKNLSPRSRWRVLSSSEVRASELEHGGSWVRIPSGAQIF